MPRKPKNMEKAEGKNLFATPAYATGLLEPFLNEYSLVWEPAAGEGRMARVLEKRHPVWTSDILPGCNETWDFLHQTKSYEWMKSIDYIVTNPPFDHKIEFYQMCMNYWNVHGIPFALLIPADYSQWIIKAVREDMCQKIIPTRRIDYLTPNQLQRINDAEDTTYTTLDEVPLSTLVRYSSSYYHSMWLTKGLNIQRPYPVLPSEIYVELSINAKKKDIFPHEDDTESTD